MVGPCWQRVVVESEHLKIYSDPVVDVYLEYSLDKCFIHVIASKWSKEIYSHFTEVFITIQDLLKELNINSIYAAIKHNDYKLKKFANMFLFNETQEQVIDNLGNPRQVYKCDF
jgi:hypothetical protein